MNPEQLFDPCRYPGELSVANPGRPGGDLSEALSLERETLLVPGDDGLPARKVALHSVDKAHYARYYADIVGRGMQSAYPGPLAWVELFSSCGRLYVKELDGFKSGSAIDALTVPKPFDHYVFVDVDPRCTAALRERVRRAAPDHPNAHVLDGDANAASTRDAILSLIPRNALVVLYADPEGLDLDFETLRFFADRYQHLDLLLNFPAPGAVRALRAGQSAKAARVLNHPAPIELIGPTSGRPGVSLRDWFQRQLGTLGYTEFGVQPIALHVKHVPIYDVMLASRQPRARQFFEEAQKRGPGGQYRMDLGC